MFFPSNNSPDLSYGFTLSLPLEYRERVKHKVELTVERRILTFERKVTLTGEYTGRGRGRGRVRAGVA